MRDNTAQLKMILRWFPGGDDSVTLAQIRQVPGVTGVATSLPQAPVGDVWSMDAIRSLRDEIADAGLTMEVIESVNVHEDIKKGLPSRDLYIDRYIQTLQNLAAAGVRCVCYNFMPVIDWARSDLAAALSDGSTAMAYVHEQVVAMNPLTMADQMGRKAHGYSLPGWEPERLHKMADDMAYYQDMSTETYWSNMRYFLDAVIPAAAACSIRMAIHPDDPPWPLYGLPKIIIDADSIRAFLALHDSPYNCITFCTGSLGANPANDLPAMIREFAARDRIPYAHTRNLRFTGSRDFVEAAHHAASGDLDMVQIMRAYNDAGFDGYMRPDHGRMIWGEVARPGYGLYDRAIGANYLLGLWDALQNAQ